MSTSDFYVYRHIRLDSQTPFYVGKGRGKRAFENNRSRNKYWKNIVKKVGYRVEIVKAGLNQTEAFKEELRLIKAYKKFNFCEANFTLGGDGGLSLEEFYRKRGERKKGLFAGEKNPMWGKKASDKQKEAAKRVALANPFTDAHREKSMMKVRKKVIDNETGQIFPSAKEAASFYSIHRATLGDYLRGDSPNKTNLCYFNSPSTPQNWNDYSAKIIKLIAA